MKTNARASFLIYFSFFLSLLAVFSWQAHANSSEARLTDDTGKTCLTGWLPMQHSQNTSCLQIVSCFEEGGNKYIDKRKRPLVTESTCPVNLHEAMASDQNVTALVNIQKGNVTHSEYISVSSAEPSSSWFYGWSAVNFGMSMLHFFKASEKAALLYNHGGSNKDAYFFASYMVGAFHHLLEMPITMVSHTMGLIPHLIAHTGMLILSVIERIKDCRCCSQFKNGHNTMIAFNGLLLVLTALTALW